jgi:hypothetical protein
MKNHLNPKAAGLAVGSLTGLVIFVLTLVAAQNGWGESILLLISDVYPYYEITTTGAFWGLLWGFLDGLIGAYILVWLYNVFVDKLAKKK